MPLPTYDAFILYSEEDSEIVADIVKNLEAQVGVVFERVEGLL